MRIVVTGHRPDKLPGKYNWVHPKNTQIMDWMADQLRMIGPNPLHRDTEPIIACTGMALGVDQMFAYACRFIGIPFTAFVPCKNQEGKWPLHAKTVYKETLKRASTIEYVHDGPYYNGCMQARNLAMRDWALEEKNSILLAVWNGSSGGTANMIKACKNKMDIIYYDQSLLK